MNKPIYVIVTPFFPGPGTWRGGYCYDFANAVLRTGKYRVAVFVPGTGADYVIGEIPVYRFRVRFLPTNIFPFLWAQSNQKSFLCAIKKAGIDIRDIVVCHGHTPNFAIYPIAVKTLNRQCLTLLHHHDLASFGLNMGKLRHCWLYKMIQFPILRKWHERVEVHVFISELCRKSFLMAPDASWTDFADYRKQMRWLPYRPAKIDTSIVLYNGVDTNVFKVGKKILHNGFVIGCIGNFTPLKNHITLLKAVDILKKQGVLDICVLMIGSGTELQRCKEYARRNFINVEFRKEVAHEELVKFYHEIDLFVLPSLFEGLGCVFLESIACGVPFFACEGQPVAELMSNAHDWLFKKGDAVDLAAKIKKYLDAKPRPKQSLNRDVSLDCLVPQFINKVHQIQSQRSCGKYA